MIEVSQKERGRSLFGLPVNNFDEKCAIVHQPNREPNGGESIPQSLQQRPEEFKVVYRLSVRDKIRVTSNVGVYI